MKTEISFVLKFILSKFYNYLHIQTISNAFKYIEQFIYFNMHIQINSILYRYNDTVKLKIKCSDV